MVTPLNINPMSEGARRKAGCCAKKLKSPKSS